MCLPLILYGLIAVLMFPIFTYSIYKCNKNYYTNNEGRLLISVSEGIECAILWPYAIPSLICFIGKE
jgi:hypothetical protein